MARTNLPRSADPLVGRRSEREALLASLRTDRGAVTLVGPPGVGKTRLAIDVAQALLAEGRFAEVWRCDLGDARDLGAACDAVAQAIGASAAEPTGDPAARVGLAIDARGDVLLVLDEMDALVGFAAETVGRWLAAAPAAALLITSREPLRVGGEIVVEVEPLSLPPPDAARPGSGAPSPGGARVPSPPPLAGEMGDAVELFVRCTQRARPAYTLTAEDAPFVAALVRELDGLPLAIELCAPRMAVMGARALLHRMTSRFDVLRRRAARPGDRHATLAAAIDASWSALAPHEQAALAQCAVFRGGFTLDAAEAVVDLEAFAGAPPILDVLQALRDRSLLRSTEAGVAGELRLGLLAGVRAFALERLDGAARAAAEARHADHVVRAAEEHERHLAGEDGAERRARVLAERDNLVEVIERVLGRGPVTARTAEPALRALLVLADLSPYDGPPEVFAAAVGPVLTATRDSGADPRLTARALHARGAMLLARGDVRGGSRDLVQALALARSLDDLALEARVTLALGGALAGRGELSAARDHFERAEQASSRAGDASERASAIASLAELCLRTGSLGEADALAARALSIHRGRHDRFGEAADRILLGRVAADRGDVAAAIAHLDAAGVAAREARSRRAEALARGWLALALHLDERLDAASAAFEAASATLAELGLVTAEALFAGLGGVLLRERGEPAEAFARLQLACDRLADAGDDAHLALLLAHLAALDAGVGRTAEAGAALDRASSLLARAPDAAVSAVVALERRRLAPSGAPGAAAPPAAPVPAHLRIALRCAPVPAPASPRAAPPPPEALLLGPSGLWFRAPHGERVALDRRRQLARMLDRLAEERLARPGGALGWDALLAAAWPGERVLPEAAAHRVRVAISTLRKLGLRDLLRTADEGYLLTPEVPALRAG